MVGWYSQGEIVDRSQEKLGESDKGVRLLRTMFKEQAQAVAEGKDPLNVYRDAQAAHNIRIPHLDDDDNWGYQQTQLRSRARTANKWSPVLKDMVKRYFSKEEAEEILKDPVH